jgi:hypothetical protein
MRECEIDREPMCETSEASEKLIPSSELLPIKLGIGRRILEVFGYQGLASLVFRLKSNHDEIDAVINGDKLPSTELLLGINKLTGASIDWLLTGVGEKYVNVVIKEADPRSEAIAPTLWFSNEERSRRMLLHQ